MIPVTNGDVQITNIAYTMLEWLQTNLVCRMYMIFFFFYGKHGLLCHPYLLDDKYLKEIYCHQRDISEKP